MVDQNIRDLCLILIYILRTFLKYTSKHGEVLVNNTSVVENGWHPFEKKIFIVIGHTLYVALCERIKILTWQMLLYTSQIGLLEHSILFFNWYT